MKKMILVTSPPGCGKTRLSKRLAAALHHVVYLDKDTLIPLSKRIFAVAGQPYDRSSDFFEENIRNYEYDVILALGFEALSYDNTVLINAPFSREVRDAAYMQALKEKLAAQGAKLVVVWIVTDPEVCHQRMIQRNSDRDPWKLTHWDEYIAGVDFSIPDTLGDPEDNENLLLYHNSTDEMADASLARILPLLED